MHVQPSRTSPAGLHAGAPRTAIQPLAAAFALVADDMAACEAALGDLLASNVPAVSQIGRYLADAGGKRLRPLLTALGARAAGHTGDLTRLMCVGEMLHLGSLLHDDVVDDGQERRGQPAAQRVFGNPAVILTGDFCLARSVSIAAEEAGLEAVTQLGHTVTAMSEGEVLQLLRRGNLDVTVPQYLEVIEKKSAALISWCAAAGAWAQNEPDHAQSLFAFGHQVGVAFQVTDDVLDYVGDKRLTGKRRGIDLSERKLTLPLLLALGRVDDLRARLDKGAPSPERIPRMIEDIRASGATDDALAFARARVGLGIEALHKLPPSPHRDALEALGHHLVERVS